MSNHSSFFQYLKTGEGRFSLLLVTACGLALSLFVVVTFIEPPRNDYRLDFGKAQWIEAATSSETNYFRKTLYLSGRVDRAWIQIAATDNFTLYVNDVVVDARSFASTSVEGLYDLKRALKPGKNVIAVHVVRDSFPGSGQLLLRGFYSIVGSPVQEFLSDPADQTWRASNLPDGILGGYPWYASLLDDSFWKLAKIAPEKDRFPLVEFGPLAGAFDPRLLETRPTAKWIAPPQGSGRQASFAYNLRLPPDRRETWLQIAATGNYDLIVNGRLITTQTAQALTRNGLALNHVPVVGAQPLLLAYNVTRWMHSGANSLLVRVSSQTLQPALLLAEGYTVRGGGKLQRFVTDGSWDTFLYTKIAQPALVVADYGDQPWGELTQQLAPPIVTPVYDVQKVLTWGSVVVTVLGGVLALWVLGSALASLVTRIPAPKLWTCDALFHLCALILMLFLWLLCFDARFQSDWCFKPRIAYGLVFLVLAGKLLLFLPRRSSPSAEMSSTERAPADWFRRYWKVIALVCIVLLGFFLRVRDLTFMSMDVDEYGVIQFSHGVEEKGYPFIQLGSFEKQVTTYELVSYSIAVARRFMGETESAYRTCALIYSTLTIALIGIAGFRMMGWRVGLVAALIFATYPSGIFWGHNAFWPSQEQLFSLATIWCFYEAVRPGPLRAGFLTAATTCFILAYLTWEGAGFLLPTMFALMFVMRWGTYDWMKDWHLWRCCVVIVFAVVIQLTHRQVASLPPYMQTGISLSDVTTPEPVWLDITHYYPDYYFTHVLFAENHYIMTLVTMFGIAFCWRDRTIRYLFVALVMLLFWYTEFLPAYAIRYAYCSESLLILASVGIVFRLLDRIVSVGASRLRWVAVAGLFATFILTTNGFVLQTYRLSHAGAAPFYGGRAGIYRCDYRGAAKFVAEHFQPGDGLMVAIPHIFEFYSGLDVDHSINTMLDKKITYSGALEIPHFLDKFRGHPCVRSLEELQDLRGRFKRIWIVQVPYSNTQNQSPEVVKYIAENTKIVFESYRAVVNLLVATPDVSQQYRQ